MNAEIKNYWFNHLEVGQIIRTIENGHWGIQYTSQDSIWFPIAIYYQTSNTYEYLLDKKEWKFYSESEALRKIRLKVFW